jgi:hypothetical protein
VLGLSDVVYVPAAHVTRSALVVVDGHAKPDSHGEHTVALANA